MTNAELTARQKFKRGDLVHIAADLGSCMSHFTADKDVIIMGSYRDQFGGDCTDSYTVLFIEDGNTVSWYHENQLTFIRHVGQEEIDRVRDAKDVREAQESDLDWIVKNYPFEKTIPGASMGELMRRIGIENPWGARGEGMTYYANAYSTLELLRPMLSTGDTEKVAAFCELIKNQRHTTP
jgi:hypothetical protein